MDKQVIDTNYFWKQKKNLLTLFAAHMHDLTSNLYLPDGGTQVTQEGLMETGKPSLLPVDHITGQSKAQGVV